MRNKAVYRKLVGIFSLLPVPFLFLCDTEPAFIIPMDPSRPVELLYPEGNETFTIGDTVEIKWIADGKRIDAVVLYISINNGENWGVIYEGGTISLPEGDEYFRMKYKWIIGQEFWKERYDYMSAEDLSRCRIKVEDYTQSGFPAYISKKFSISLEAD